MFVFCYTHSFACLLFTIFCYYHKIIRYERSSIRNNGSKNGKEDVFCFPLFFLFDCAIKRMLKFFLYEVFLPQLEREIGYTGAGLGVTTMRSNRRKNSDELRTLNQNKCT